MIKSFSAYTTEIDDVEFAVSDLVEKLDFKGKLLKNSIGIVSCFADFVESGVIKALSEKLPFEIIGTTTIANTTKGEIGDTMLSLLVLTSDNLEFITGITEPIKGETQEILCAAYEKAISRHSEKPSLMFSFVPLLFNVSGDFFVEAMDNITGNLPNFGTLPVDHNPDYSEAYVILDGKAYKDCYAFLLIYGDIKPDFYIGTISDEKIFPEKGAITASQGNQLQSVNGKSTTEFLLSVGLTQNEEGNIAGINAFPIIINYNDGTEPVVRAMFAVTPDGSAVCGGKVPVGATLTIGRFDADEIISTSANALEKTLSSGKYGAILIYSCIGRFFALEHNPKTELEMVNSKIAGSNITYMMSYSGGEICPVYKKDGTTANRSHNNTFIICAF